ncbi:MAG: hypothetical protein ACJ8AE_12095 [Gemmatimonadaceae bacterium]
MGAAGATGATGSAGPNNVTTSTATNLSGFLKGNGATVTAASAIALGTDVTGILPSTSHPALTGDVTTPSGSVATTVARINGVALSGLATGILKNTNGTGVPSIAVAADFPTLNQSTTGNAATATNVAGTGITGTTLAAGVVSSSLTSVGTLTGLTVNGATNINASNNAATYIGTGTTTSPVAVGGGSNTVTLGAGTAFSSITYGAATTGTIPNLAANSTVTATATVTGCAVANHLLITASSYSVNQTVVVKSATCSAANTATITFLNTNNGNLTAAGTLTFKYMVIRP